MAALSLTITHSKSLSDAKTVCNLIWFYMPHIFYLLQIPTYWILMFVNIFSPTPFDWTILGKNYSRIFQIVKAIQIDRKYFINVGTHLITLECSLQYFVSWFHWLESIQKSISEQISFICFIEDIDNRYCAILWDYR